MNLVEVRNKLNLGYSLKDLNLRVTYYARVSTDNLEQINSLKNQKEYFEKQIKANKNWEYINGYIDEGITGTSDIKRINFMKMIEDAKNNMFDLIITKEISRFSRNTLDSIKYTRELLNSGVAVLFLNDNINTIYPDSELRLTIMSSLAQDEIRRLSDRVKFGMHQAQKKGVLLGNSKIYGYKKIKKENRLEIVKEEAKIVKKIYELYVFKDLSLNQIKNYLNDRNIKTKANKKWNTTAISRIIKNPKYKGYYCGKKVEVLDYINKKIIYKNKNDWIVFKTNYIPKIIDDYVWNKANIKIDSKYKKRNSIKKGLYINKLYCEKDKHTYTSKYFRNNKKELTYICNNYLLNGKCHCDTANIRETEINKIIDDIQIDEEDINKILSIFKWKNEEDIIKIIKQKEIKVLFIDKIYVKKDNDIINMKIYSKFNLNIKENEYLFKRGYDIKNTRKYNVKYKINFLKSNT